MVEIPNPRDVLSHEDEIESYNSARMLSICGSIFTRRKEYPNQMFLVNERFHIFE
jgi:hypothetical protein